MIFVILFFKGKRCPYRSFGEICRRPERKDSSIRSKERSTLGDDETLRCSDCRRLFRAKSLSISIRKERERKREEKQHRNVDQNQRKIEEKAKITEDSFVNKKTDFV